MELAADLAAVMELWLAANLQALDAATSRLGFEARRMEELYCLVQRRAA